MRRRKHVGCEAWVDVTDDRACLFLQDATLRYCHRTPKPMPSPMPNLNLNLKPNPNPNLDSILRLPQSFFFHELTLLLPRQPLEVLLRCRGEDRGLPLPPPTFLSRAARSCSCAGIPRTTSPPPSVPVPVAGPSSILLSTPCAPHVSTPGSSALHPDSCVACAACPAA